MKTLKLYVFQDNTGYYGCVSIGIVAESLEEAANMKVFPNNQSLIDYKWEIKPVYETQVLNEEKGLKFNP